MDCEFTQEVSPLVDGELAPHEAARLRAHVEGCADCQRAREAFLLLRQELRSYERAPDPQAQSAALAAILGSRTFDGKAAAPSAAVWGTHPTAPRGMVARLFGSITEALGGRGLRPAHVATLALLLIVTALGVRWLMGSSPSPRTRQSDAPAAAGKNDLPVQATARADVERKSQGNSEAVGGPTVQQAKSQRTPRPAGVRTNVREGREGARVRREVYQTARQGREGLSRELPREVARVGEPISLPPFMNAVVPYAGVGLPAAADAPASRIGRHAERVERLLRSFRNSRLTERDSTLDVADARRLSKRLLYSNIALRREAASAGDLPVEDLLDSVEPILLDIANLPNAPSPDAVGSIKERINRRQLVGALQTQGMQASR